MQFLKIEKRQKSKKGIQDKVRVLTIAKFIAPLWYVLQKNRQSQSLLKFLGEYDGEKKIEIGQEIKKLVKKRKL